MFSENSLFAAVAEGIPSAEAEQERDFLNPSHRMQQSEQRHETKAGTRGDYIKKTREARICLRRPRLRALDVDNEGTEPQSPPQPHPHGEVDFEKLYQIKTILDERRGQYLIDWEDDEITGERYEPSWEPKGNVTKDAVADWKQQKAGKPAPRPTTPKRAKGRQRKIVESSPEVSPAALRKQRVPSSPQQRPQPNEEPQDELEIVESQQEATADVEEIDSPLFEPIVQLSDPPSSFQAGAYQHFSLDAADSSEPIKVVSQTGLTSSEEQPRSVPVNFGDRATRVVPDSQSAVEFSSSAPAVTTSEEAPQPSSAAPEAFVEAQALQTSSAADEQAQPGATEPSEALADPGSVRVSVSQSAVADQPPPEPPLQAETLVARETSEAPTEAARPSAAPEASIASETSGTAAETQRSVPQNTQTPSHIEVQSSDGRASVGRPLGSSQIQRSLASSFPFQTQIGRPSSSGALQTPLHASSQFRAFSSLASVARASSLPPGQSSPVRSSSPIASLPSRSIGTLLGESAPSRPATPSSPLSIGTPVSSRIMETSQALPRVTQDLAARLKAIREQGRAKRQGNTPTSVPSQQERPAETLGAPSQISQASSAPSLATQLPRLVSSLATAEQDRRSPSAIPAVEPQPKITLEEMNTSERYETLVPQAQESMSGERPRQGSKTSMLSRQHTVVGDPQLSSSHVVPIALLGHQRDQYPQTVNKQRKLIEHFLATADPDAELIDSAERFVDRMRQIALHPDLDNEETFTQYEVEPKQQAQWDVDCSAKFRFLKELLNRVRDQTLDVAIVAQSVKVVEMLATFLTGIIVPHRRMEDITSSSSASDHDGMMVTLVSADDEVHGPQASPADLVIVMDPRVSEDCMPIKAFMEQSRMRPPLITLVVSHTIEHVEQSVSGMLATHARLRALVSGIYQYRNEAGKLDDDQLALDMAAQAITDYLAAPEERGDWPIPTLGALPNLDSQTESDLEPAMADGVDGSGQLTDYSAGTKRTFISDDLASDTADVSKKARYEQSAAAEIPQLPMTINPQDIEITHVSDSVNKPTQPSLAGDTDAAPQFSSLSSTEQRLAKTLEEVQERLEEHVQALSNLQYRHEEQREKLIAATNQRDSAILTAQQAVTRMTEASTNTSKLKIERTELKQQLEEANDKLLDHTIPERAAFEALRLTAAQANAERERLERRLESAQKELNYSRDMYQSSSQSAQNFASQTSELENQLAVAQNKATGEQVKLRQMGYDSQTKSLRDENRKLKAILKDREAGLKFRDEEIAKLKEASRGRMGTRGTSVPRTPRLGSPMKMDGVRGRGSRQGSPVLKGKGGLLHPLRNG